MDSVSETKQRFIELHRKNPELLRELAGLEIKKIELLRELDLIEKERRRVSFKLSLEQR